MKALTSHHTVSFQREGHVMVGTIGPPIVGGHVNIIRLPDELLDFRTEVGWEEETRVIIFTGSDERSFSIGEDWIKGFLREGEGQQQEFCSIAEPVAKLDRPVIAAISGDAIGQGLELALGCDIRIAAETSHFGLPHIKTGLIPYDGGTQRLSRLVGRGKAFEMILTGEIIDAQEALRIGLVNRVVSKGELMEVAMKLAQEMASKGPIALRYAKEAIYKGMDMTLEQGLRLEADLYLLIHTSKDRTEGIRAFREKRAPKFEGK
jgi:enoyl-CoA hydratase/carnithine racemase